MNVPEGAGRIAPEELNRQLTAVCKIEIPGKEKGTGFVGHLQNNDKDCYYLITNHHVLQHEMDKSNVNITFEYSNMLSGKSSTKDTSGVDLISSANVHKSLSLSGNWFTDNGTNLQDNTKYGLDCTMIEVEKKEVDELKISPFDLTPTKLDEDDQLIVAGHPVIDGVQQHLQLSFHRCKKVLGFFVYYGCSTCKGSSGSSVLKVVDGKLRVVALHCASQEKYLNYGSLFSAVLSHASLIDGNVCETTKLMVKQFLDEVKWKPLEMADLLRLLQPVESNWKSLAHYLLEDKLQSQINTIELDCFHNNASKNALDDVFNRWLECTTGKKRSWQTLCDAAKKYGDESLEQYVHANYLESNGEPTLKHLNRWSKDSPLRTSWYNFGVELVGKSKAEVIRSDHFGGGVHSCLERMLVTWYDSTIDHSWQVIIDALTEMDQFSVIECIEKHCLTW